MKQRFKRLISLMMIMMCAQLIADSAEHGALPADEKAAIKTFFNDFKGALNAKDVESVKRMSGEAWKQWMETLDDGGRFEALDVLSITAGKQTNAVVKCMVVDRRGKAKTGEVVFTMKRVGGAYTIDKTIDPVGESRKKEFKDACHTLMQLITSINNRSMESVKAVLSFTDASDFDAELSARGLSWIKEALDKDVKISQEGMGVSREGKSIISGRIYVPDASGGTNIVRKVIFKDGKIDRAAPREETKEEFHKRFEKEKAERRRQFEKPGGNGNRTKTQ